MECGDKRSAAPLLVGSGKKRRRADYRLPPHSKSRVRVARLCRPVSLFTQAGCLLLMRKKTNPGISPGVRSNRIRFSAYLRNLRRRPRAAAPSANSAIDEGSGTTV